jgi:hypothetical protein
MINSKYTRPKTTETASGALVALRPATIESTMPA